MMIQIKWYTDYCIILLFLSKTFLMTRYVDSARIEGIFGAMTHSHVHFISPEVLNFILSKICEIDSYSQNTINFTYIFSWQKNFRKKNYSKNFQNLIWKIISEQYFFEIFFSENSKNIFPKRLPKTIFKNCFLDTISGKALFEYPFHSYKCERNLRLSSSVTSSIRYHRHLSSWVIQLDLGLTQINFV